MNYSQKYGHFIEEAAVTAYGIAEAKAKFSTLIEQVERGEAVTITRHGKTVARILPVGQRTEVLEALRSLRDGQTRSSVSSADLIRQLRDEGY
jgi:prevent-host-death family protein